MKPISILALLLAVTALMPVRNAFSAGMQLPQYEIHSMGTRINPQTSGNPQVTYTAFVIDRNANTTFTCNGFIGRTTAGAFNLQDLTCSKSSDVVKYTGNPATSIFATGYDFHPESPESYYPYRQNFWTLDVESRVVTLCSYDVVHACISAKLPN